MPIHPATRISCHVYPLDRPNHPVNTHCQEHHVHSASSAASGAIQQIATIESTPDTSFEIRVDIDPMSYARSHRPESPNAYDDFLIFVILDGVKVQRSKRHRSQRGPTHISGIFTHDGRSRHFKFAKLQLVDPEDETLAPEARKDLQDTLCSDEKICQSLGTIRVDIVRCELGDKQPVQPRSMGGSKQRNREVLKTSNQMKFSEHTKKVLLTDTAGLSDAHMPTDNSSIGNRPFNGGKRTMRRIEWQDKHPFIQFIFEYSSRAVLEAKGLIAYQIAPPPPPPPRPPPNFNPNLIVKKEPKTLKDDFAEIGYAAGLVARGSSVEEEKPKLMVEREYISIEDDDDDVPESKPVASTSKGTRKRLSELKAENIDELEEVKKPKLEPKKVPEVIDLTACLDSDEE